VFGTGPYHVVNCFDDPDPEHPGRVVVDVCKSDGTNALGREGHLHFRPSFLESNGDRVG
jgi:hypothetical protein